MKKPKSHHFSIKQGYQLLFSKYNFPTFWNIHHNSPNLLEDYTYLEENLCLHIFNPPFYNLVSKMFVFRYFLLGLCFIFQAFKLFLINMYFEFRVLGQYFKFRVLGQYFKFRVFGLFFKYKVTKYDFVKFFIFNYHFYNNNPSNNDIVFVFLLNEDE